MYSEGTWVAQVEMRAAALYHQLAFLEFRRLVHHRVVPIRKSVGTFSSSISRSTAVLLALAAERASDQYRKNARS
jgi:hypothetical protein